MCIRRETREKARRSLAFSRVSKPHTHITHMLRQCTSIVYIPSFIDFMKTKYPHFNQLDSLEKLKIIRNPDKEILPSFYKAIIRSANMRFTLVKTYKT